MLARAERQPLGDAVGPDRLGRKPQVEPRWAVDRADQLCAMDLPVIIVRETRERLLTGDDGASASAAPT